VLHITPLKLATILSSHQQKPITLLLEVWFLSASIVTTQLITFQYLRKNPNPMFFSSFSQYTVKVIGLKN